jgi:Predicted Fe-S-cluster oxidoreductase
MYGKTFKTYKKKFPALRKSLRGFLNKFDKKYIIGINRYVDMAASDTWQHVNCLECGHCCKSMTPTFRRADIKRIAAHFQMTEKEFEEKWLKADSDNADKVNKTQPCQFLDLKTNKCSIYEIRPKDCADFPHFQKKPFADFNHVHTQNINYCPATFHFVTTLKEQIERDYVW